MEKRKLEMTLETARKLYESDKESNKWLLETFPELKESKSWKDLGHISGHYIDSNTNITQCYNYSIKDCNKNLYATKAQARSALAYAQITQLMKDLNGDWRPKPYEGYYTVLRYLDDRMGFEYCEVSKHPIYFKTQEQARSCYEANKEIFETYFNY